MIYQLFQDISDTEMKTQILMNLQKMNNQSQTYHKNSFSGRNRKNIILKNNLISRRI